jgi:hypothetical protein
VITLRRPARGRGDAGRRWHMRGQRPAWIARFAIALLLVLPCASRTATADGIAGVEVDGTAFVIKLLSGNALRGRELAGATLSLTLPGRQDVSRIRIASVSVDPMDPEGEVLLHHIFVLDPAGGPEEELCEPDPQGERWAFPLKGQWDNQGQLVSGNGFTLTCSAGAQGKCVRFGYKPWKILADGTKLDNYHMACIRMVRADYCGGNGTTRDGMLIDFYDRLGIQHPANPADAPDLRFEAAWNTEGAVCVAHTRVPANMSMQGLTESCPRLRGRLGEAVCAPDALGQFGPALLFNRSR